MLCCSNGTCIMSVEVRFRVRTGDTVYGEAPGCGSGSLDVSRQLSLVGSIPELGAWCLSRRVPVLQKADLGTHVGTKTLSAALIDSWSKTYQIYGMLTMQGSSTISHCSA